MRAAAESAAAGGPPGSHQFQENLPQKQKGEDAALQGRRDETRRDEASLLEHLLKFQWFGLKAHACASHPPITGDLHHQSQPEDAAAAGWTRAGQLPADIAAGQTLQFHI